MHQKGHVRRLSFGGAHGGGGVLRAQHTRFVSKTLGTYKLSPCLFEVGIGAARAARGAALGGLQLLPVSKKGGL
jgi:hypothetical protein